jgi:hypothetical protein
VRHGPALGTLPRFRPADGGHADNVFLLPAKSNRHFPGVESLIHGEIPAYFLIWPG